MLRVLGLYGIPFTGLYKKAQFLIVETEDSDAEAKIVSESTAKEGEAETHPKSSFTPPPEEQFQGELSSRTAAIFDLPPLPLPTWTSLAALCMVAPRISPKNMRDCAHFLLKNEKDIQVKQCALYVS